MYTHTYTLHTCRNALHEACLYGHIEVARVLLDYNIDIEAETYGGQWAPLHMASVYGHLEIVKVCMHVYMVICVYVLLGTFIPFYHWRTVSALILCASDTHTVGAFAHGICVWPS